MTETQKRANVWMRLSLDMWAIACVGIFFAVVILALTAMPYTKPGTIQFRCTVGGRRVTLYAKTAGSISYRCTDKGWERADGATSNEDAAALGIEVK